MSLPQVLLEYRDDTGQKIRRSSDEKSREHQVTLTGLEPGSDYSGALSATDISGNESFLGTVAERATAEASDGLLADEPLLADTSLQLTLLNDEELLDFSTDADADTTIPTIVSGPEIADQGLDHLLVQWETDEATTTSISFGLSGGVRDRVRADLEFVTNHLVILPELLADESYDIVVSSTDVAGNVIVSETLTASTLSTEDNVAPVFLTPLTVSSISDNAVTLTWSTDDYSFGAIECAATEADSNLSVSIEGLRQDHVLSLEGLDSGTSYQCNAVATDVTGNVARSDMRLVDTTGVTADSDADGLIDADELVAGTDPALPDTDSDGVLDGADAFPLNELETRDSDSDGVGDNADLDDDGDSLPDEYEIANGLDPLDASDAAIDTNGNGVSNLEEFLRGQDVGTDTIAPELVIPANVIADSRGLQTFVEIGDAIAFDSVDGLVEAVTQSSDFFAPGRNNVVWSATDIVGNTSTAIQVVDVLPQVNFAPSQFASEGSTVTVEVLLNGNATVYPLVVPFTVHGTATVDEDYVAFERSVIFESGTSANVEIQLLDDEVSEGDESLILLMGNVENAVVGPGRSHTTTISEQNLPPTLELFASQDGRAVASIGPNDGPVTLSVQVVDPDPEDSHTYDWSGTDNAIVSLNGFTNSVMEFDPFDLSEGIYEFSVTVQDDGEMPTPVIASSILRISAINDTLSLTLDSDGDGISDAIEGTSDADGDRIPDYADISTRYVYITCWK